MARRRVRRVALGAAVLGVAGMLACIAPRRLIFPAPRPRPVPVPPGAALLEIPVGTAPGPAFALHLPAPPGAPTLVWFHGNAEQLADQLPLAERLHARGLGVYAIEYPGYGPASQSGRPSERAIYAAAEAALAHLRQALGVPPARTVLAGRSLGSGVAVEMARRGHGARLLLLSAYTSIPEVAAWHLGGLPLGWLVRDRFDSAAKTAELQLPVLLVHGTRDPVIPAAMSERLAASLPRAEVVLVPGAGHNDLFARGGEPLFERFCGFALQESAGP
ncbi:MAG: alpha/beta hydrolase [Planctomycetota bacterium]|nr:MAG: alpha/beta hydrolase [Planctomycetota bacterium]